MKGIKTLLTGILAATMIMGSTLSVCATDTDGTGLGQRQENQNSTDNQRSSTPATGAGANVTIRRKNDSGYAVAEQGKVSATQGDATKAIQSYTVYKIFDASITTDDSGNKLARYYIPATETDRITGITNTGLFELLLNADETEYTAVLKDVNTTGELLASKLNEQIDHFSVVASPSVEGTNESVSFHLDDGYYLIISNLGSLLIADTVNGDTTIDEKATYPTIDKLQKDTSDNQTNYQNANLDTTDPVIVKIGDTIDYKLEITLPANANKEIVVTDTMSAGLTLNQGSIVVSSGSYTGVVSDETDNSFKVTFAVPNPAIATMTSATITFTATVNASAVSDSEKKNEVTLDYDNYHQVDYVPYKMMKTAALKYDLATKQALNNVEFELLMNDQPFTVKLVDGVYIPATGEGASATVKTGSDGYIRITGLDGGTIEYGTDSSKADVVTKTFKLRETKTKDGYNLPTGEDAITQLILVDADADEIVPEDGILKEIPNGKGAMLPTTGGIGTTIFYIVGGLLIVAGAAYFIVRRKASAE